MSEIPNPCRCCFNAISPIVQEHLATSPYRDRSKVGTVDIFVSTESLNAQEERLATSPLLVTRLHLPHAIVMRLHVYKDNVVIFTLETEGTVGV